MTSTPGPNAARPRRTARVLRLVLVALVGIVVGLAAFRAVPIIREHLQTARSTAEFDPPVWAGQVVPAPCATGGFYARRDAAIVLTISAHCYGATPDTPMRDAEGRIVGVFGPAAELPDCPEGRFCAPSDFLTVALAPERIPWGHLNLVDFGAGGYRTIPAGTAPLACGDIHEGDRAEVNGNEHYRQGTVVSVGRYEFPTDTIFPCMVITDIEAMYGDSGGAVLVNDRPAGITAREISGYLAFTPLAEGLDNLGLVLCTTPDCDMSPDAAT